MNLKPGAKRRLACEKAVYNKFKNFVEVNDACIDYIKKKGLDISFSSNYIKNYIAAQSNMSMKRLNILCEVLGVTNYSQIDEIFTAPDVRGIGLDWVGERGTRVKDYDMR